MPITVTSTAFVPGAAIPACHTREERNQSPPLAWSGIPPGCRELALVCEDPDAPRAHPFAHWVAYRMPPMLAGLPEAVPTAAEPAQLQGGAQGRNDNGLFGWTGPMPPQGHGPHHYHFRLYALDTMLDLAPGLARLDVLAAMRGRIIGTGELVGRYERR